MLNETPTPNMIDMVPTVPSYLETAASDLLLETLANCNETDHLQAVVTAIARLMQEREDDVRDLVAEVRRLDSEAGELRAKLALIRATATRSMPMLINLAAIDRILNEGKEAPRG